MTRPKQSVCSAVRRQRSLSLLIAMPLLISACSKNAPADPRTEAPNVRVAIVQAAGATSRSFTGTVAARVQSDLGFRVSGKVVSRLVDVGQAVKRGEPLMRIDPVDLKLAATAQDQAVAAARALAERTASDEERYRDLRGTGAVSISAYDQVRAAADSAKAQLAAAEAQAGVARNANGYSVLVADSDGVVTETLAEPGQVVSPGQPVIRLAHAGRREAVIQLPETLRPAVGSDGQATLFGKPGTSTRAVLRQLANAADPVTRTFEARYVLDGALADAPFGATVTVRVTDGVAGSRPLQNAPAGALVDQGKGPGLWVIGGSPARVSWRPVTVEAVDDQSVTFTGDVQPGERVIALGAHLLREGEVVRIADASVSGPTHEGQP